MSDLGLSVAEPWHSPPPTGGSLLAPAAPVAGPVAAPDGADPIEDAIGDGAILGEVAVVAVPQDTVDRALTAPTLGNLGGK